MARAEGNDETARARYSEALALYERIQARRNVALAHERLAGVSAGTQRDGHLAAARALWLALGIDAYVARVDAAIKA